MPGDDAVVFDIQIDVHAGSAAVPTCTTIPLSASQWPRLRPINLSTSSDTICPVGERGDAEPWFRQRSPVLTGQRDLAEHADRPESAERSRMELPTVGMQGNAATTQPPCRWADSRTNADTPTAAPAREQRGFPHTPFPRPAHGAGRRSEHVPITDPVRRLRRRERSMEWSVRAAVPPEPIQGVGHRPAFRPGLPPLDDDLRRRTVDQLLARVGPLGDQLVEDATERDRRPPAAPSSTSTPSSPPDHSCEPRPVVRLQPSAQVHHLRPPQGLDLATRVRLGLPVGDSSPAPRFVRGLRAGPLINQWLLSSDLDHSGVPRVTRTPRPAVPQTRAAAADPAPPPRGSGPGSPGAPPGTRARSTCAACALRAASARAVAARCPGAHRPRGTHRAAG